MVVIRLHFRDWKASGSGRIWILCENLWQLLHVQKEVSISLEAADRALEDFSFQVRRRFVKKAIKETQEIVARHFMTDEVDILVENPENSDD